jgi:hypothetical protein
MSNNKFKYFTVTTTSIVKAPNKTMAEKIALSSRGKVAGATGELLYKDVEVDRITSVEAHGQLAN